MKFVTGKLRSSVNKTNLRTIAVSDDHFHSLLNHIHNMSDGIHGSIVLIWNGFLLFIFNQGIPTHGNNCNTLFSIKSLLLKLNQVGLHG